MKVLFADNLHKRQLILIKVNCLLWLITKLISYNAWIKERTLPTVSFVKFLDTVPAWTHLLFYSLSLLLLLGCFVKTSRRLMIVLFISELSSVILDAIRLQPWEYLYLTILLMAIICYYRPNVFFRVLMFLLVSTYIYSGLQKFSGAFLATIWDYFILKNTFGINKPNVSKLLHYSGLLISICEFGLGFLLLFLRTRKFAAICLIAMHLMILVVLGVVLKGYNYSVLPWNIVMIFYLFNYLKNTETYSETIPVPISILICVLWFILPFTNLFGFWAHYLSSGMYTGKTPVVYICLPANEGKKIDKIYNYGLMNPRCANGVSVSIYNWTNNETGLVPFPQLWYYERLLLNIKHEYNDETKMFYTVYPHRKTIVLN